MRDETLSDEMGHDYELFIEGLTISHVVSNGGSMSYACVMDGEGK